MTAPNLLNDDGTASMATLFMMAHHGFRRDLGRFASALRTLKADDNARADALRGEWKYFHGALHGHHEMEDTRIFSHLKNAAPATAPTIDRLGTDHRALDPLLARGDAAFAALPDGAAASAVVAELTALLDPHLALEEAEIVPLLRGAREFPAPQTEEELALMSEGFAWSTNGIAPDVLEAVYAMLPPALTARLPTARAKYAERCVAAWGHADEGAARTPIPTR